MKSSTRLSIALVFSVTLLFSCSLLFWNAQAQISLEKVTIGDKFVRIQTGQGAPVIDVQLLENTDHCFTECYAILKIHPYQDITLPAGPNSEFAWNFVKDKPWMDGLISYHFEILETVEYAVDIPEYGAAKVNSTCYGQDNATYACKADQTIQTGSHQETRQSEEYKPFAFWGETLKADTDYTIKLAGEKSPSVKTNNIDWRPVIKGLELDEWEWWNTTWNKCRKIVNSSLSDFVSGYEAVFTFNNATIPYADFMSGFADLRITNGTECNGDSGSEMNFYINTIGMGRISGQPDVYVCNQSNTSASCSIFINMTLTNQTGFLMYYNASGVSSASNMIKVFTDSANFNNNNISDWTQSRGSNTWIAEGGVLKSDVISGDSWIYRNFISGRSTNNFILTFDFYRNDTQGGWVMLRNKAPPSSYMGFTIDSTSAYQSITWEYVNGSGGSAASLPGFSNLIWYNYALVVTNKFQNLTRNSTSLVNYTLSNPPSPFNLTTIGKGWTTAGRGVWFDNVIVRQYVSNPPSWSIGETETQYNIIIHSPENTTYNTSSINLNWSYSNMSSLEWAGYSLNDGNNVSLEAGLVYQESADSASCAGSWSNCGNTYDSDWESWGYSNEGSWVYFNYTKPSKAASANWTIKSGSHWGNHTVPEACFNSTVLQFGAYSFHGDGDQKISNWSCWNGIGWQSIYYEQSEYGDTVYEEAVWWLMENNFVNTTIIVQEGSNKLALCANDTGGGMACETVYFTVDLTPPSVSVTFPQNNGQYDLTWINVTGTAEDANPDSIWTNDSIFGQNVGTFQSWNFTNNSMKRGPYSVTIYANDSAGNVNSTQLSFFIGKWNVTFNIYSGETGENLTNVNVNCNNSWSGTIDSYESVGFEPSWWSCWIWTDSRPHSSVHMSIINVFNSNIQFDSVVVFMELWVDKYKPANSKGILSQASAVNEISAWLDGWKTGKASGKPSGKALFLSGPPGSGKTLIAEVLAKERGWMLAQVNASDERNAEAIQKNLFQASKNLPLFFHGKIILVDEVELFVIRPRWHRRYIQDNQGVEVPHHRNGERPVPSQAAAAEGVLENGEALEGRRAFNRKTSSRDMRKGGRNARGRRAQEPGALVFRRHPLGHKRPPDDVRGEEAYQRKRFRFARLPRARDEHILRATDGVQVEEHERREEGDTEL
jgi:hypothetical protein